VKRSVRAVSGIAALVSAGPACALEVTRSRDIPVPPAAVWALVGEFCAIGLWHPQVERCILSREDDDDGIRAQIRGLVTKGGLGTIVEVETARDEAAMSYSGSAERRGRDRDLDRHLRRGGHDRRGGRQGHHRRLRRGPCRHRPRGRPLGGRSAQAIDAVQQKKLASVRILTNVSSVGGPDRPADSRRSC